MAGFLKNLNLNHELLNKYESVACESFDEKFVSLELVLKNADEANLSEENKKIISDFFDYADDDLKKYIWLYYYIQFNSDEDFKDNIWRLDEIPKPTEAEEKFPGCINSVTYLLAAENLRNWLSEHNMPSEMIEVYYEKYRNFVRLNLISHKTPALCRLSAFLLGYAKPFILQVGRLVYQLIPFRNYAELYENSDGKRLFVALPNYTYNSQGLQEKEGFLPIYEKTDSALLAHVFKSDGTLSLEPCTIDLNEYKLIRKPGDLVATIHIPTGSKLTKESVKESIELASKVLKEHIQPFDEFVCQTWFIDPSLRPDIIRDGSNMADFADIFDIICATDNENHSIFEHVFNTYRRPLDELVPKNSFQERILKRAKEGKKIYWSFGVLKKGYLND